VHPEAHQAHHQQHQQAHYGRRRRAPALPPVGGGEHQEGQQQARRELYPHPRRQRCRARPQPRKLPRRQRQGAGNRQQHKGVVVGAPHRQHQQDGVEANEGRRPAGGATQPSGRLRDQGDGGEAREDGDHLECPQPPRQAEGHDGIAGEGEQGAVGRVQEGPPDVAIGGVPEGFRGHMGVGVQSMEGAHAGEGQVSEDILGDQRRPQRQDHVGPHDRDRQGPHRQRAGAPQNEQIARGHHQDQRLKGRTGKTHVQSCQRPRQPPRPAPHPRRNVLRGAAGGPGADQQGGHEDAEEPQGAQGPQRSGRRSGLPGPGGAAPDCALRASAGYGSRDLDAFHCYVWETCKCPPGPVL
jgi:hypothetical protein